MGKRKTGKNKKKGNNNKPNTLLIAAAAVALILFTAGLIHFVGTKNDERDRWNNVTKPVATIEMETGGTIKVELDPENAPNTVKNFITLAEQGFYNGLIFHRVIPGFMIQGGCPQGQGTGSPGYRIKGEFSENGFDNNLEHERGVISMARSPAYDSAGSQFFITVTATPHLDGQYAAFGRVIDGMDEVDRIASVETGAADRPMEDQVIRSITVETFGIDYDGPEKVD